MLSPLRSHCTKSIKNERFSASALFVFVYFKYLQSLDGAQWGEQSFADSLQLVVVQWKQVEVLQVLEGVDSQTVNFVGIQQPETQGRVIQHLFLMVGEEVFRSFTYV